MMDQIYWSMYWQHVWHIIVSSKCVPNTCPCRIMQFLFTFINELFVPLYFDFNIIRRKEQLNVCLTNVFSISQSLVLDWTFS